MLLGAFTVACALETALVTLQTWRGVPSHFNMETTFDTSVARILAAGGLVLVIITLVLTFTAFRTHPTIPISVRVAIQIGFVGLVAAVVAGALMIAKGMVLVFAGDPQAAYATGGGLKATHAVTMHAILVLPALAWLLSFANWSERRRLRVVLLAAAGYVVLAGAVAIGNVIGLALVNPEGEQGSIRRDAVAFMNRRNCWSGSSASESARTDDPAREEGVNTL
jgi:hypothetical protein